MSQANWMDMGDFERTEADVLVIGSGAAGLYAALCAAQYGQVTLITKATLGASSSAWAQGGIAAAVSANDSPQLHAEDTLCAGRGLCDRSAVRVLTEAAPGCIERLLSLGMPFDKVNGGLDLGQEGGHSRRRILHAGGSATGDRLVSTLVQRVQETDKIQVYEHTWASELLLEGEGCLGAFAYDFRSGGCRLFLADATVLATGGAAGLYGRTTNPPTSAGEGVALAYRAGAEIMDMEFIQFHPTALYSGNGRSPLISEAARGEGAFLLNAEGHHFMPDYHEMGDLAARDVVARAIHEEMKKSGDNHVFLSLRHLGSRFLKQRFSNIYEACLEHGVDITRDLVPVAPAAHYCIGGVRTDLDGRTNVEGLWACGEVAACGVHGANRLASNSLLECIVFAERVVNAAKQGSKSRPRSRGSGMKPELKHLRVPRFESCESNTRSAERLAASMSERVGLLRSQAGLSTALMELEEFSHPGDGRPSPWRNRLLVSKLIAQSALLRTETRGVQFREDFAGPDVKWQKHIVLRQGCEPRFVCL